MCLEPKSAGQRWSTIFGGLRTCPRSGVQAISGSCSSTGCRSAKNVRGRSTLAWIGPFFLRPLPFTADPRRLNLSHHPTAVLLLPSPQQHPPQPSTASQPFTTAQPLAAADSSPLLPEPVQPRVVLQQEANHCEMAKFRCVFAAKQLQIAASQQDRRKPEQWQSFGETRQKAVRPDSVPADRAQSPAPGSRWCPRQSSSGGRRDSSARPGIRP